MNTTVIIPNFIDARCEHDTCEARGRYVVGVRCTNCDLESEMLCTKGHDKNYSARSTRCPRCDCDRLRPGNYLRDGDSLPSDS